MRNDLARLEALRRLAILDTSPEQVYDDLIGMLVRSLDVPIAMVNLLDGERDWFKGCIGLPMSESPAATSFCEAFFNDPSDVIVVEDTRLDARFAEHPLVVAAPFIRFYAAARLQVGGHTVGTLCAYDIRPHRVTQAQLVDLQAMGNAAVHLLDHRIAAR